MFKIVIKKKNMILFKFCINYFAKLIKINKIIAMNLLLLLIEKMILN